MKDNYPNASEEQLELKRQRLLARLAATECRWLAEWSVAMMGLYSRFKRMALREVARISHAVHRHGKFCQAAQI